MRQESADKNAVRIRPVTVGTASPNSWPQIACAMTIDGNLIFAPDSVFRVKADFNANPDRLNVTGGGHATINEV